MPVRKGRFPKPDPMRYCGIIFIGGGTSWAYAATEEEAADRAATLAKSDWGAIFKFEKKHPFTVFIYDTAGEEGWHAEAPGKVIGKTSGKLLQPTQSIRVIV